MKSEQSARRFFLLLLLGTAVLLGAVVLPMASAIFLACVLAGVLWPLNRRLSKVLRNRRGLAAGLIVFVVVVVVVGPLVALSAFVVKEGTEGVKFISETVRSEGVSGLIETFPPLVQRLANEVVERLPREPGTNVDDTVGKQLTAQGGKAAAVVGTAVSATGALVFQAVMMLIALFFLLESGERVVAWVDDVSPLRKGQTQELLAEFKKVSYSVLMSTLITSAVQAAAALVGYFIARVPHPLFFAAVTFFFAFIPAIGAGSVCLAAAGLLFLTGHPYMAIFLGIWGLLVVGLVDNLVKPLLMKGGMEMHGAIVFFALLGGLAAFGAIGLLIGPLVVALFLALVRMYQRDFSAPPAAKPVG